MKKYFILFMLLLCSNVVRTQVNSHVKIQYNSILKEKVFVHYNSSLLLTGEYLKYKIYCIRDRGNKISGLSKITYIELVNSDKKIIFQHKIRLNRGVGFGEYFLPTTIKSGNYKLVAYTQAMRNEGEDYFFQGDISIVNPFRAINANSISDSNEVNVLNISIDNKETAENINNYLKINTNQKKYKKRSKVLLKIEDLNNLIKKGTYSISVRKVDLIKKPKVYTAENFSNVYLNKPNQNNLEFKFFPEFEGDLIIGKVISRITNKPAENIRVVLSIPNEEYFFKFAKTNSNGRFIYKFKSKFTANKAKIQVLDNNRDNFKIEIEKTPSKNYQNLKFNDFKVSSSIQDVLLENSIQNQIENSYQSVKLDSISDNQIYVNDLLRNKAETYLLDDYTRFSTVKETILEIVKNVSTKKRKGKYSFQVKKLNPYDKETLSPLVTVDGILIQDLNKLAEFDAKKVKSISVVRDKFYHDDFKFQGIVSVTTFNNDFNAFTNKEFVYNYTFFSPIKNRKYFSQKYDEVNSNDRIPDYRRQLLWDPKFSIKENGEMSFFTSDVNGDFEISLEGFLQDGTPVSCKHLITVE